MKKIIGIIVFLVTVLIVPFASEASMKLVYDGKTHIYNSEPIYLHVNGERLDPPMPPIMLNGRTLVPARAVFEKTGAKVSWNPTTQQVHVKSASTDIVLKINNNKVKVNDREEVTDMPAKLINGSTMIPLRFVAENIGMKVGWDKNKRIVSIDSIKGSEIEINSVKVTTEKGKTLVRVEASGSIINYSKMELESPDRVVIDIPDSTMKVDQSSIPVSSDSLKRIRVAQYQVQPNKSRIVLDLAQKTDYDINISEDKKALIVGFEGSGSVSEEICQLKDIYELNEKIGGTNSITLIKEKDKQGISISINNSQDYRVSRLTEYNGIELAITKTSFNQGIYQTDINDSIIKYLRCQNDTNDTGRIIIGVEGQPPYQVFQEPGKLTLLVLQPSYKNIEYAKNGTASSIIINDSEVADKITYVEDKEGKSTVFTVPAGTVQLGSGNMHINDEIVESIIISEKEPNINEVTVRFNYSSELFYKIMGNDSDKTVINISTKSLTKLSDGKLLVVIDPGHGGYQPGAVYKSEVLEKDLNLDIALRLNSLLEEAGIETVMTRDEDVFVGLHERADMANRLEADLFISIHNNWIDSPSFGGTMTLYYPSNNDDQALSGKRFAEIIQEELLSNLGTTNRKVIPRPDLVVLNSTKMPAVLAEIGFISNESDRKKLMTPEFRQKAAEALKKGALKALDELE